MNKPPSDPSPSCLPAGRLIEINFELGELAGSHPEMRCDTETTAASASELFAASAEALAKAVHHFKIAKYLRAAGWQAWRAESSVSPEPKLIEGESPV